MNAGRAPPSHGSDRMMTIEPDIVEPGPMQPRRINRQYTQTQPPPTIITPKRTNETVVIPDDDDPLLRAALQRSLDDSRCVLTCFVYHHITDILMLMMMTMT